MKKASILLLLVAGALPAQQPQADRSAQMAAAATVMSRSPSAKFVTVLDAFNYYWNAFLAPDSKKAFEVSSESFRIREYETTSLSEQEMVDRDAEIRTKYNTFGRPTLEELYFFNEAPRPRIVWIVSSTINGRRIVEQSIARFVDSPTGWRLDEETCVIKSNVPSP